MIVIVGALTARTEGQEIQSFSYHESFESGKDPFKLWRSNGKFTIGFKGVTDDKAYSGKKSFKVDVTEVHGDTLDPATRHSRYYWYIPLPKLPVEGDFRFSAWIHSDPGLIAGKYPARSTHQMGLKYRTLAKEAELAGQVSMGQYHGIPGREYKAGWKLIEGDVVRKIKADVAATIPNRLAGAAYGDLGVCVDGIYLMMDARPAEGGVIYVDDIRIEAKIPSLQAFKKETARRWNNIKEMYKQRIELWENLIDRRRKELDGLPDPSGNAQKMKAIAQIILEKTVKDVAEGNERGYLSSRCLKTIDRSLRQVKQIACTIKAMSGGSGELKDTLIYVVEPMMWERILPDTRCIPGEVSTRLSLAACRGEYEPVSFVVHALENILSLTIEPTELKSSDGAVIDSEYIDVKFVKCWYQAGNTWDSAGFMVDKKIQTLVPELLLNDDSMIRIDSKGRKNYLKVRFADGDKYVWINDPDYEAGEQDVDVFPINDSLKLLPADDIPERTNRQIWVTVHVPEEAKPGNYRGQIRLSRPRPPSIRLGHDETLATLTLELQVLPFELAKPYYIASIYYNSVLVPESKGRYHDKFRSEEQFRAEHENLVAHGVTNPTFRQPYIPEDEDVFRKTFEIRREAGMTDPILLLKGGREAGRHTTDPEELAAIQARVRKIMDIAREYGMEEVYFLGLDERKGKQLTDQRPAWTAIRHAGGKIFSTSTAPEAHIREMGDITDLLLSTPGLEHVEKLHALGGKVAPYTTFSGSENPLRYRRDYGLRIWKGDLDGICMYTYLHHHRFMWNDMDGAGPSFDMTMTYSTTDGVLDTIAWEGYREGIDDVRYITTLTKAIEKAGQSEDAKAREAARKAQSFLDELKSNPYLGDLDEIRAELIELILELRHLPPE